ncbi:nitroreductase family protein [Streptomyces sp. NPDC001401]|uniref:nitroreductase family protein n=1 Tax=Streptomyces sp. NPDC001401 TaxID=3364570 RepID=UPI003692CF71
MPLDAETLEACVAAAVAAPSFFNTQPWRFRLDPDTVTYEVRADPESSLHHADPAGRALHLPVGGSAPTVGTVRPPSRVPVTRGAGADRSPAGT